MPASCAAIGTEFVTTVSSTVGRQRGSYPAGGGPRVDQHAGPAERKEVGRGRGDGVLVFGAGVLAFTDAGLDQPQCPHRYGAAVHPPHQPGAVQDREVATDRLGGDVVGLCQIGDRGATVRLSPMRRSLADALRHTWSSVCVVFGPYSMLVSVVLLLNVLTCQPLVCNLLHMTTSSPLTSRPSARAVERAPRRHRFAGGPRRSRDSVRTCDPARPASGTRRH